MHRRRLMLMFTAVVFAGIGLGAYYLQPPKMTRLEIEMSGGFAYIPSPNDKTLFVAYLNDVLVKEDTDKIPSTPDDVVCDVPQVGTELTVIRGVVDTYQGPMPMPESRTFDLDGAKVTFPGLNVVTKPLPIPITTRKPWKPNPLKVPNHSHAAWKDLQYVPRIADHDGLKNRKLLTGWQKNKLINGYIALRGGVLEGSTPSDPVAEMARFEFRVGGVLQETVTATDKTFYIVNVEDDKVEINFNDSKLEYKKLVLKPDPKGAPVVRLRLRGLHAMNAPPKNNDELRDFCAFHALLTPEVKSADYLRIYYKEPPRTSGGAGNPSPGFFCPGDWF